MRVIHLMLIGLFTLAPSAMSWAADDDGMMEMFESTNTPYFQPVFGQSMISLENAADIENGLTFGAILGFEGTRRVAGGDILRHQSNGLYLYYMMEGEDKPETFSVSSFRFGFTSEESYGYGFQDTGNEGFYLSAAKAPLSWYSVNVKDENTAALAGAAGIERFPGSLRFGESATAGIGVRVSDPITINAGFEWAQVYERHIFWYWAGSALIEGVADGLANWFVREVGKNSPVALPIMHFILRNGVAMGFKALRQDQMNWPISSAAPMNIMTYSIGVNVHF